LSCARLGTARWSHGPGHRSPQRITEPGNHGWPAGSSLARQVVWAAYGWRLNRAC
jgi:hypothetical protein